jgi:hypothetical protein
MSSALAIILVIFLVRLLSGGRIRVPPWLWVCVAKLALLHGALMVMNTIDYPGAPLLLPALVLICAPTLVLKWIVVPLRMPRVAYWTVRIGLPLGCVREIRAGSVMYGALALARKGASNETIVWLEQRLNGVQRMRGAGVVAAGLLAALRRDRDQARCLLLIADTLPERFTSRRIRAIARDWLVADAARIGDWRKVIRLGRRSRGSLRWSYALARIGERLIGDKRGCGDWLLWLCFLFAPRRRATYPLLRRALAVPARPPSADVKPAAVAALPLALADLARAIEGRRIHDGTSLARSVGAVDGNLDSMRAQIDQRLRALGGRGDADAVISAFRQCLIGLLIHLIEEDPHLALATQGSPILSEATRQVRLRLFRDIEARCKDYDARTEDESALDEVPEWATWAMLRRSADRLLELDPESKIPLFQTMYVPVTNFAVLQFNRCKRNVLAHDMFSWLLRHSQSNHEALQLLAKNVQAALTYPS